MFMFVILLCTLWFLLAWFSLPLSVHRSAIAARLSLSFPIFCCVDGAMGRLKGAGGCSDSALTPLICDSDCRVYLAQKGAFVSGFSL